MNARRRQGLRSLVALVLLVGALFVAGTYAATPPSETRPLENGTGAVTAVTIDATGPSQLVVYGPAGEIRYRNASLDVYHDVDPVATGGNEISYVASEFDPGPETCSSTGCIRNVVERVNLTTGEVERRYAASIPSNGSSQTHDVDRVNESVLLVADISHPDRVYMVNTTTGEEIWEWRVSNAFDPSDGGQYPTDWTHLNDVEYLDDGRVMVSLRNMDQVVFVDPGAGLQADWTLGSDDDRRTLFEQHNPDYIPAERGGPAVVVADSENNRIVEYQRTDSGEWTRSWQWRDARMQWPRDADRLPDGGTMVADSHGNRLLEIAPDGEIRWQTRFPDGSYDVEVLGTGDESAGGQSARRAGYVNATGLRDGSSVSVAALDAAVSLIPNRVLHGLLFALPDWVTPGAAVVLLFEGLLAGGWIAAEGLAWGRRTDRTPFR